MDIRWKDENGNILNANNERLIYLDAETNEKIKFKKEDVKKIVIEDGLMHIFKDFENDLVLSIIIPKKNKRDAVKIFNEYDKTGTILKSGAGDFLLNFILDLIFESSLTTGNPFFGIMLILFIVAIFIAILSIALGEIGAIIARVLIIGLPIYFVLSFILLRIKRKRRMEKNMIGR